MANSITVDIIQDGRRNAIVSLVGLVDSADMVQAPVISLNQFTNNDPGLTFNGFRVVDVDYAVTDGLVVQLAWQSSTPQPIYSFSGASQLCGREHGGIAPDRKAGGYNGNINLNTKGFVAGRTYGFTVKLKMTKMYAQ